MSWTGGALKLLRWRITLVAPSGAWSELTPGVCSGFGFGLPGRAAPGRARWGLALPLGLALGKADPASVYPGGCALSPLQLLGCGDGLGHHGVAGLASRSRSGCGRACASSRGGWSNCLGGATAPSFRVSVRAARTPSAPAASPFAQKNTSPSISQHLRQQRQRASHPVIMGPGVSGGAVWIALRTVSQFCLMALAGVAWVAFRDDTAGSVSKHV